MVLKSLYHTDMGYTFGSASAKHETHFLACGYQ